MRVLPCRKALETDHALTIRKVRKLVDVALPQGLDGTYKLPKTKKSLINCWWAIDKIINRPGISELTSHNNVARGQFVFEDEHYAILSTELVKITDHDTGAYTVVGSVAGFEPVDVAIGFVHAVIVVRGSSGKGYTFDGTTLTEITDLQFQSSNSVTHINGRFVYVPYNGDPAFFSDVGNGASIQAASFFDAEELPDKNEVAFNFTNTLYIAGTDSIELFRNTGTDSLSFTRLQNGRIQAGYIGGILEYNLTFLFVGREKDQDLGIYSIGQGHAPKISNEYIDTILRSYTIDQLKTVVSSRFKWNGYDIATFTFPNHSFGYLGGFWFELSTQLNNEQGVWQGGYIQHYKGKYYTAYNDKIGVLADVTTDYGQNFERGLILGFESEDNADFSLQSLTLNISQGFNDNAGSVFLSLSRDGVLYPNKFARETGRIGEYDKKLFWNYAGGMGYYKGFVGVKLWTTEKIDFSATKLTIDIR